ncbi:MAG: glycosyl hydrolase 108 family protein [Candidatus Gracilibacteria bacterium]|jgi:lysozyme family protein
MASFDEAVNYLLRNEGGLSESPYDHGGTTHFGISLRFLRNVLPENLRRYGIFGEVTEQTIRELTVDQAKLIYKGEFWEHAAFDKINNQDICNYIFDMSVNMGIAPAIKCAQRACWAVKRRREILDDGLLGDKTLNAIKMCDFMLLPAMRSERAGYYRIIAAKDYDQERYIDGWLNRAYESNGHSR